MKRFVSIFVIVVAVPYAAFGMSREATLSSIATFTISTNDPARSVYYIVDFLREGGYSLQSQRVLKQGTFEIAIRYDIFGPKYASVNQIVLVLSVTDQGVVGELSYWNHGDGKIDSSVVDALVGKLIASGKK